jgi:hypothetical protein
LLVVSGAGLILFAIFPVERQLELLSHWATDGVADVDISHPILGMIPIVTGGVFVVISLLITPAHYKGGIGEKRIIYSQEIAWFAKTVYSRINKAVGDESPTHLALLDHFRGKDTHRDWYSCSDGVRSVHGGGA